MNRRDTCKIRLVINAIQNSKRNDIMRKFKYIACFLVLVAIIFQGCEEKANEWEVQPENNRLFRPLVFDLVKAYATDVELKYTKVVSADKYIFEFSKDSLVFGDIVNTVEVLADTLTPFAESSTTTRTEFRTVFSDLDGTTGYSVRVHALDTVTGLISDYSTLYFETAAEQIFTRTVSFTDQVQMFWNPTDRLTGITVATAVKDETTGEYVEGEAVIDRALTADEISNANALLSGLTPGTNYIVKIYNNENVRGSKIVSTFGLSDGVVVPISPTDVLADVVTAQVLAGNTNLILNFEGGETYDIGSFTIPSGVTNISFTGSSGATGEMPLLNLIEVRLSDLTFGRLVFENVKIVGNYGKYFFYSGADGLELDEISFRSCDFSDARSIVRFGNNVTTVGSISFDDCLVNNIGGYGVINIGGNNVNLNYLAFENSTWTELATQLVDIRTPVNEIVIGNCTFCNFTSALSQLLRLDTNNLPLAVTTSNNIFAGNNAGATVNSLSFDMTTTGLNVSFGGSYSTTDLEINKYGFADITYFPGTTYDLFVDPDNGDFTVKSDSGFGGRGTAGDPRWF